MTYSHNILFTVAVAALLSACGGSGSSTSYGPETYYAPPAQSPSTTNASNTTETPTENPDTPAEEKPEPLYLGAKLRGGYYVGTNYVNTTPPGIDGVPYQGNVLSLILDGDHEFRKETSFGPTTARGLSYQYFFDSGDGLEFTRSGILGFEDQPIAYFQGITATDLPSSGIVSYYALGKTWNNRKAENIPETSVVLAEADFHYKKIKISVIPAAEYTNMPHLMHPDMVPRQEFEADITAHVFESSGFGIDLRGVKGMFFGQQGHEIGGIYYDRSQDLDNFGSFQGFITP